MRDIESRADIETFMRHFYDNLLRIEGIPAVFEGIDLEKHLPHIVHFWSFVLLDEEGYKTNIFEKHLRLPITAPQFDQWLETFISAVDDLYAGEKAELAKSRAAVLAFTFKNKWQHLKNP